MRSVPLLLVCLCLYPVPSWGQTPGDTAGTSPQLHRIAPRTPEGLRQLLRYDGTPLPLVSAHRGGSGPGLPENCIATFEATLRKSFAILEIDPRYAKDGAIVVLHDATLDRTTTGSGRLNEYTLADLRRFKLRDTLGDATEYAIPTLDEVLEWARGKTVLILDQKDVTVADRVRKIEEHHAEAYAMLIVYSFQEAQACHALNKNIMMEVMIPNLDKVAEFSRTGVPWQNIIAFVGHIPPEDKALYDAIHQQGACCIVGSSRNLDRQLVRLKEPEHRTLKPAYQQFLNRGADLIETDLPRQVGPLLYQDVAIPPAKAQFFLRP